MARGWYCPDLDEPDPNDPETRGVDPDRVHDEIDFSDLS